MPASVDSKLLTCILSPLDATLTKNIGGGGRPQTSIYCRLRSSISHYLHLQPPSAGTIKLAKENALPPPQHQLAAFHVDDLTRAHKHRLHMRVRVPLAVPIRPRSGYEPVERAFDVPRDTRVRAVVDGDRCCRLRHIQIANAAG